MTVRMSPSGLAEVRRLAALESDGNVSAWVCQVVAEAVQRRAG